MTWILALLWGLAQAQEAAPAAEATDIASSGRLSFDERVVRGQVAAGSVYLFQRKPRALPGLVPVRRSYRAQIVEPLLAERAARKRE